MTFHPFPVISTDRLHLRETTKEDIEEFFFLRSDAGVNRYIKKEPLKDLAEARELLSKMKKSTAANQSIDWCICLKGSTRMIGSVCLWNFSADRQRAETGYLLNTRFQGQGIMQEALKAVLNYGFNKAGFTEIEAYTHYANARSINLLQKSGFEVSGKEDEFNADNVVLSITRTRFKNNQSAEQKSEH